MEEAFVREGGETKETKEGRKEGGEGTFQNHDFDDKVKEEDRQTDRRTNTRRQRRRFAGFGGGGESFVRSR